MREVKKKQNAVYTRSPVGRFSFAKRSAKQRNLRWSLSFTGFKKLLRQPCTYCERQLKETGIGLDRIDNKRGYSKSNVLSCCGVCNRIRSNKFNVHEMKHIGYILKRIYRNRK